MEQPYKRQRRIASSVSAADLRRICESPISALTSSDYRLLYDAATDLGMYAVRTIPLRDLCRHILDRLDDVNHFDYLPDEMLLDIFRWYQTLTGTSMPLPMVSRRFQSIYTSVPERFYDTKDACPQDKDKCALGENRWKGDFPLVFAINTEVSLEDQIRNTYPVETERWDEIVWNCGCVTVIFPLTEGSDDMPYGPVQVGPYIKRRYFQKKGYFTLRDMGEMTLDFYNEPFQREEIKRLLDLLTAAHDEGQSDLEKEIFGIMSEIKAGETKHGAFFTQPALAWGLEEVQFLGSSTPSVLVRVVNVYSQG